MASSEQLEILGRKVVAEIITLKLPGGTAFDALQTAFAPYRQGVGYSDGWIDGYISAVRDTIKFHHLESQYRVIGSDRPLNRWEDMSGHHPDTLEFRRVWKGAAVGSESAPFTRWQPVNTGTEAAVPLTTADIEAERLAAAEAAKKVQPAQVPL